MPSFAGDVLDPAQSHGDLLLHLASPPDLPKLRLYLDEQDVPDPYGGDADAFAEVVALVEAGADRHL
ncbi:hypothetical protein ACQ86D_00235 [Streptomyces galilaeus]